MNTRTLVIVSSVVMFHLVALWALHTGLLRRMAEVVVPVMMVSQSEPPPPPPVVKPAEPLKPPPPVTPKPPPQQPVMTPPPSPPPTTPAPVAPEPAPVLAAPAAPAATATVPNPPPAPAVATPAPTLAAAPSAPVKVELPNSKADYLHNPPPEYPPMSVRRGEQGQVLLKVLIGADGLPQKVELLSSSGFERLDKAALEAAMRWRYVPGKRGGVAEAMWYQVPMVFNLKKE
jgi:protein TonB